MKRGDSNLGPLVLLWGLLDYICDLYCYLCISEAQIEKEKMVEIEYKCTEELNTDIQRCNYVEH